MKYSTYVFMICLFAIGCSEQEAPNVTIDDIANVYLISSVESDHPGIADEIGNEIMVTKIAGDTLEVVLAFDVFNVTFPNIATTEGSEHLTLSMTHNSGEVSGTANATSIYINAPDYFGYSFEISGLIQ